MSVTIHRNLNDRTPDSSQGWVITPKGEKSYRVASVVLEITGQKISKKTLDRIRTPKGELTESGASGIGKRTVGAWLVGKIISTSTTKKAKTTIHFNPFYCDEFQTKEGETVESGTVAHFKKCGTVEVIA